MEMLNEFLDDMAGTRQLAKRNRVPLLASSIAFFSIFSMFPFLILCFAGSQYLFRQISSAEVDPQSQEKLKQFLDSILPSTDAGMAENFMQVLKQNSLANIFNVALCAWSAFQLFNVLHYAFEQISERRTGRNALITNLVSGLCFMVMVATSTLLLLASTTDTSFLKVIFPEQFGSWDLLSIKMLVALLGTLAVIVAITFIYKLMPLQKVKLVFAFRGSVLFLLFFIVGRFSYEIYAKYYSFMNAGTFGPFFTFIMMIVWIYYVSRAFLFAAQYSIYLQEKESA
mgnify:CR=1 FL=1